jgi:hypothetical protein
MTFATNTPENMLSFIRTLRTSGTRCTVIAFVDQNCLSLCVNRSLEVFANCGLSLINLGNVLERFQNRIAVSRQVVYYGFLYYFQQHYRRVILADVTDTIFQQDPFTTHFTDDMLAVSTECITYKGCVWNLAWIKSIDEAHIDFYLDLPVINSGLILGSTMNIMRMLAVLMKLPAYTTFAVNKYDWGIDQAFLGMVAYRGMLRQAGLNLTMLGPDSPYASLFHCRFALHKADHESVKRVNGEIVLSILHQYNRYPYLINLTSRNCPMKGYTDEYAYTQPKQTWVR